MKTTIERPKFAGEVLICEDSGLSQFIITEHLSMVGLSYVVADNGKVGVDIVTERIESGKKPFDLILMDIFMPIMDGLEATTEMIRLGCTTPIVAVSALLLQSDKDRYSSAGMVGYLGKPFSSHELWEVLTRVL